MKYKMKRLFSNTTTYAVFLMLLVLPLSTLTLAYLFRNDTAWDKPKIVEEGIKSVVSLFISVTILIASNASTKNELNRKATGLRQRVYLQLSSINELMNSIITSPDLLDKDELEKSTAEIIRNNYQNELDFKVNIGNLNRELEVVRQIIISSDSEIGMICSDYLSTVSRVLVAIKDYLTQPSSHKAKEVRTLIQSLLVMM